MTKKELAIALHDKGYNCCQSVVCAFKDELDVDEATLFKAGEGFGFGMGNSNGTCGAVSGAVIPAGLLNSTANYDGPNSKPHTYDICKKI